MMRSGAGTG